jgi:hypothetical protein
MSTENDAVLPLNISEPEKYLIVAHLLRERARRPELPPEQVAKANSLADYFETLANDPSASISVER